MSGSNLLTKKMDWRGPACTAALSFFLTFAYASFANYTDAFFGSILYAVAASFVCSVIVLWVLAFKRYKESLFALLMIPCALAGTSLGLKAGVSSSTSFRWLLHSGSYKVNVLRQPNPSDGSLRHAEWDSWGFAGAGFTTEYLVFDPADSLPRRTEGPARFKGVPCEVPSIRRMAEHWFVVRFYTDTAWEYCG